MDLFSYVNALFHKYLFCSRSQKKCLWGLVCLVRDWSNPAHVHEVTEVLRLAAAWVSSERGCPRLPPCCGCGCSRGGSQGISAPPHAHSALWWAAGLGQDALFDFVKSELNRNCLTATWVIRRKPSPCPQIWEEYICTMKTNPLLLVSEEPEVHSASGPWAKTPLQAWRDVRVFSLQRLCAGV